jgi:hypothetical protein
MCNYVWHFHRDEYHWHMQPQGPLSADMQNISRAIPDALRPFPRVAVHSPYHPGAPQKATVSKAHTAAFILPGLCRTLAASACRTRRLEAAQHKLCGGIDAGGTCWAPLFQFESLNWATDARCMDAQREYYARLRNESFCVGEAAVLDLYDIEPMPQLALY